MLFFSKNACPHFRSCLLPYTNLSNILPHEFLSQICVFHFGTSGPKNLKIAVLFPKFKGNNYG